PAYDRCVAEYAYERFREQGVDRVGAAAARSPHRLAPCDARAVAGRESCATAANGLHDDGARHPVAEERTGACPGRGDDRSAQSHGAQLMSERMVRVSVRILEKEYQVACLPEERSALLDSADYLNARMREIRDTGNVVGLDRVAVMAALNITHELLQLRGRAET